MFWLFFSCALIAGTIFLFQFVLLIVGFGLDGVDMDLPDDADVDFDAPGDADFDGGAGEIDSETGMMDHGSTFLFGVISVRTVVAAVTMFGLVGMATLSAMGDGVMPILYAIVFACAGGIAAMFGVHYLMRTLYRLGADGKVRPRNALGREATVYLTVPADGQGAGKIQIRMQGRLVELAAVTNANHEMKTGATVRVTGIVAGSTVCVEAIDGRPQSPKPQPPEEVAQAKA